MTVSGQKTLRIEGKIANFPPQLLVLSQYFGGQLMPIDTTASNLEGKFVFEEKDSVQAGLFRIVGIGRGLDLVVSESFDFSLEADARDVIGTIRFSNAPDNALLFDYQRKVRARYQPLLQYRQQAGIKDDNDPRWRSRFEAFNLTMKSFTDSLYAAHPQWFVTRFLKSFQEPQLPVLPVKTLSAKDSLYLKNYAWQHTFDNAFLSDERMLYTAHFSTRVGRFVKNIPALSVEELKQTMDKIIPQTNGTKELRKYLVGQLASRLETTAEPHLDALYEHIVKNYVETDPALWDASTLQKVREMREIRAKMAIGKVFPDLKMTDIEGKPKALGDLEAEHTLLFFYDPGCSHCRETAPKLTDFVKRNPNSVSVYAVSLDANEDTWRQFIKDFQTESFANVRDAERKTDFYKLGVWNYPAMYLLDRDKKIVARWLTVEELERYFSR